MATSESKTASLFVYGTLCVPVVRRSIIGRETSAEPASLPGFRCEELRGVVFPGIQPAAGERAIGALVKGLSEREFQKLDDFEADLYQRQEVTVDLDDETAPAFAYVVAERHRDQLTGEPWSLEEFVVKHLDRYKGDIDDSAS